MGIRQPGVQREHRHLDSESEEEGGEHPDGEFAEFGLGGTAGQGEHVECVETALEVEGEEPEQHESRPEQGEQEELDGGIEPHLGLQSDDRYLHRVAVPPDANHEVHRQQHHLEEHEEQNEVESDKGAVHSGGQHQDER